MFERQNHSNALVNNNHTEFKKVTVEHSRTSQLAVCSVRVCVCLVHKYIHSLQNGTHTWDVRSFWREGCMMIWPTADDRELLVCRPRGLALSA